MKTLIHESTNTHYTEDEVFMVNNSTIYSPFIAEHIEHESIEIPYDITIKSIVVEKNPYEDKLREIQD